VRLLVCCSIVLQMSTLWAAEASGAKLPTDGYLIAIAKKHTGEWDDRFIILVSLAGKSREIATFKGSVWKYCVFADGTVVLFDAKTGHAKAGNVFDDEFRMEALPRLFRATWGRGLKDPHFSASPVGKKIAYVSGLSQRRGDGLYVYDAESGTERAVVAPSARRGMHSPAWSPDGKEIAFYVQDHGNVGEGKYVALHKVDLVTSEVTELAPPGYTFHLDPISKPVWSPDGSLILFLNSYELKAGRPTGWFYAYVVPKDGGDVHSIGPGESPGWTRDGKVIVARAKQGRIHYDLSRRKVVATGMGNVKPTPFEGVNMSRTRDNVYFWDTNGKKIKAIRIDRELYRSYGVKMILRRPGSSHIE